MGNNPSTSKPASQSSSFQSHSQNDRPVRRDNRNPIFPVQTHRVAAPPEPSLTQAQGTAVQPPPGTASRPKPLQHRPGPSSGYSTASSSATAASSTSSAKPVEVKQGKPGPCHEPAKPVAVPNTYNSPSSPRSPRSPRSDDIYEAAIMPHSSLQDVSYMTRPPRLPLPIEEEVHTPGSPIILPTEVGLGEPLENVEGLNNTRLIRPTSTLSDASAVLEEDDDAEELLVDKNRPTVPTLLEWRHGGEKIYVTGTIFQWNRKTRLHPV